MTAERIESICRYANYIYFQNPNRIECFGGTFEDFKQEMLLQGCLHNEDNAFLLKCVYNDKIKLKETLEFDISNMLKFSELGINSTNQEKYIEELIGGKEDNYFFTAEDLCIKEISFLLYPDNEELFEDFLDFLHGAVLSKGMRWYKMRLKCFNHRFEILQILYKYEKISREDFEYFNQVAQSLDNMVPAKKKNLKDSYDAKWQREKYYSNLEESRRKNRERAQKRRERIKREKFEQQARQADSEQSKGDI